MEKDITKELIKIANNLENLQMYKEASEVDDATKIIKQSFSIVSLVVMPFLRKYIDSYMAKGGIQAVEKALPNLILQAEKIHPEAGNFIRTKAPEIIRDLSARYPKLVNILNSVFRRMAPQTAKALSESKGVLPVVEKVAPAVAKSVAPAAGVRWTSQTSAEYLAKVAPEFAKVPGATEALVKVPGAAEALAKGVPVADVLTKVPGAAEAVVKVPGAASVVAKIAPGVAKSLLAAGRVAGWVAVALELGLGARDIYKTFTDPNAEMYSLTGTVGKAIGTEMGAAVGDVYSLRDNPDAEMQSLIGRTGKGVGGYLGGLAAGESDFTAKMSDQTPGVQDIMKAQDTARGAVSRSDINRSEAMMQAALTDSERVLKLDLNNPTDKALYQAISKKHYIGEAIDDPMRLSNLLKFKAEQYRLNIQKLQAAQLQPATA